MPAHDVMDAAYQAPGERGVWRNLPELARWCWRLSVARRELSRGCARTRLQPWSAGARPRAGETWPEATTHMFDNKL